jgi:hypothetical protein
MPEIVIAIPVYHDLILHPCLQAAERNGGESTLDRIPIDSEVDVESTEGRAVIKIRARNRYAVARVRGRTSGHSD